MTIQGTHSYFSRLQFSAFMLLALIAGPSAARSAPSITVDLTSKKDNTLYEPPLGQVVSNGAGTHLFVGATANPAPDGDIRRALLMFDVAGTVPAGSTITSAVMTLNMSKTVAGTQTITVHRVAADWGEGGSVAGGEEGGGATPAIGDVTWINRFHPGSPWTNPGGDFSSTVSASADVTDVGSYSWGSTSALIADVQVWLDNPAGNFGWVLIGNESVAMTAKRFDSRENATASARPKLSVTYVPPSDCNHNGLPDDADVSSGTSKDCNANGVPDECEPDSDGDGVINACDTSDPASPNQPGMPVASSNCGACGAVGAAPIAITWIVAGRSWLRRRRKT